MQLIKELTLTSIGELCLTLNPLTTTIVEPPSNTIKWQMGFNLAFKGLKYSTTSSANVKRRAKNVIVYCNFEKTLENLTWCTDESVCEEKGNKTGNEVQRIIQTRSCNVCCSTKAVT
jgi:hypothetical protein